MKLLDLFESTSKTLLEYLDPDKVDYGAWVHAPTKKVAKVSEFNHSPVMAKIMTKQGVQGYEDVDPWESDSKNDEIYNWGFSNNWVRVLFDGSYADNSKQFVIQGNPTDIRKLFSFFAPTFAKVDEVIIENSDRKDHQSFYIPTDLRKLRAWFGMKEEVKATTTKPELLPISRLPFSVSPKISHHRHRRIKFK